MTITADGLKTEIESQMSSMDENSSPEDASQAMATAIINYLKDNLEVKIPVSEVIVSVVGGSGAPAVGAANITKIACEIS